MELKLLFTFLFVFNFTSSQEPVLVTESTIVLDLEQTKELVFSFAEGDEIVFNMEMVKGKNIKEIEITEEPSNSLFTEFKPERINNRKIQVRNKGIYKFRFYSSSITRRVCKISIYRIPANVSTKNFNTNWKWETVRDTSYTSYQEDSLVGYKTIKYQEMVRELKEKKTEEILLFEKSQKVHSFYNENLSRTYLRVDLPVLNNIPLREESLIAWSYWIGVGQEGQEAYKENLKSVSNLVSKMANAYYKTPLAGLAVGAISELIIPQTGEDVEYYFINDFQNVENFLNKEQFYLFDQGKGRAAYGRNDKIKQGTFFIGLSNDNPLRGIEVDVKVLALKEIKIYENNTYNKEKEEPQFVTLNKTKMNINETKKRVPVE
ncbi:hypothetical protein [Tenacibaculum sp.]|uniref:hypothetical protein n=1 Tax=Tenacibaculum sp. TaxID=1906242 RepID=UPI003D0A4812